MMFALHRIEAKALLMPIPPFQEFHLPVLTHCGDGAVHRPRDVAPAVADTMKISPEDRDEMLPSGTQSTLQNRVNWALYDLFRAGLLHRPTKGRYSISELGRKVLSSPPPRIDRAFLNQFPQFKEWTQKIEAASPGKNLPNELQALGENITPDEQVEQAFQSLNRTLASDLLEQVGKMDPFRFEQLVVDLLFAMGYGGSRQEAAKVTKKSNDEGIDGIINEDRLGLNVIYIQAKRWQNTIGRKELQGFVGALAGQQASKGIFITTSDFNENAKSYVKSVPQKIILIDGARLTALMIEHNIGISITRTISLKRIDSDYFEEA